MRFIPGHHRRGAYPPLEERFRSRVDVKGPDDCWEWTAGKIPGGYGAVWDNSIGRHRHAHRLAWELANGPIPDGLWVLHRCDNPPCCNPAHLWLGTQHDNDMDRTHKHPAVVEPILRVPDPPLPAEIRPPAAVSLTAT